MDIKDFNDIKITCKECGEVFTWTAGEQAFYQARSLFPPKRCRGCCKERRARVVRGDWGVRDG